MIPERFSPNDVTRAQLEPIVKLFICPSCSLRESIQFGEWCQACTANREAYLRGLPAVSVCTLHLTRRVCA